MRISRLARRVLLCAGVMLGALGFGAVTQPAAAVCGGGGPGEPCHCPGDVKVLKFTILHIDC